jgi:hypothetical protein
MRKLLALHEPNQSSATLKKGGAAERLHDTALISFEVEEGICKYHQ